VSDDPPPGVGLVTVNLASRAVESDAVGKVAVSWVVDTKVELSTVPSRETVDCCDAAEDGEELEIVGTGLPM
jgi:hypothetical protein